MTSTSDRSLLVLKALAAYYTLARAQIQALSGFRGGANDDRACRKLLLKLLQAGLVNKTAMQVVNPGMGAPAPVYYPSRKGLEYLACETGEDRWLSACCLTPNWQHLYHWTQVAEFHIRLDLAVAVQSGVTVERWLGEWDLADPQAREPEKRYRLFTLLREQPRLVANPDAGFLLSYRGFKKVYFLELDRGTSSIAQIAASKPAGFAEMARQQLHKRCFPQSTVNHFSVLLVTTTPTRRDLVRKALASKDGAALWKCCAWADVTPERLLFEPIFHDVEGTVAPLVRRVTDTTQQANEGAPLVVTP